MRVQKSYGIACYRKINKNPHYEFIFINKRLTYYFIEFMRGMYGNSDQSVLDLLNKMTVDEKVTIKSLNFHIIWYKYCLEKYNNNQRSNNIFNKLKTKFYNNFMVDNGKRLLYLIDKSYSQTLLWELPKGHKDNKEFEVNAAIREFYEETSIPKYKYKIMFSIQPIIHTFIDNNVKYVCKYFVAKMLDKNYVPQIKMNVKSMINETSDIKFLNIYDINLLINDNKLISEVKNLIKKLKGY